MTMKVRSGARTTNSLSFEYNLERYKYWYNRIVDITSKQVL